MTYSYLPKKTSNVFVFNNHYANSYELACGIGLVVFLRGHVLAD